MLLLAEISPDTPSPPSPPSNLVPTIAALELTSFEQMARSSREIVDKMGRGVEYLSSEDSKRAAVFSMMSLLLG